VSSSRPSRSGAATAAITPPLSLDGELVCVDAATGPPFAERLMGRTESRLPATPAAELALEGVVAKRVPSRCSPGRRTPCWRKVIHRWYEWFDLLGWRALAGRSPGGLLVGRAGLAIAWALPAPGVTS
jgi:ATP-dependent DNA ligase